MNLHVLSRVGRHLRTLRTAAAIVILPLISAMSCDLYEDIAISRLGAQWAAMREQILRGFRAAEAEGCHFYSDTNVGCPGVDPSRVRDAFASIMTACQEISTLSAQARRAQERLQAQGQDSQAKSLEKFTSGYVALLSVQCSFLIAFYRDYDREGYQAALAAGRQDSSGGGPGTSVDLEPRSPGGQQTAPASGGYTPPPGGGGGGGGS